MIVIKIFFLLQFAEICPYFSEEISERGRDKALPCLVVINENDKPAVACL